MLKIFKKNYFLFKAVKTNNKNIGAFSPYPLAKQEKVVVVNT